MSTVGCVMRVLSRVGGRHKPPTANAEGTEINENTLTIIPTVATPTLFGRQHAFFDVTTDKPSQNTKWTLAILATLIQESIVDNIG